MLRIIERSATHVIQKVTRPNGNLVGYNVAPVGSVGDTYKVERRSTLVEARKLAGIGYAPPVAVTTPKAECPHNQKGYRADSQRAKAKH